MRSLTAEKIYENDKRFDIKSAWTHPWAKNTISQELLDWADVITVMEKLHRNVIRKKFPEIYDNKKIICLYIPDNFEYMEQELIDLIKERFEWLFLKRLI